MTLDQAATLDGPVQHQAHEAVLLVPTFYRVLEGSMPQLPTATGVFQIAPNCYDPSAVIAEIRV